MSGERILARRDALRGLELPDKAAHNVGLTLAMLLPEQNNPDSKLDFLKKVVATGGSGEMYRTAFARWKLAISDLCTVTMGMETSSPVALGLGNASPLEIGLTLHRTYGLPYLPGSALKGLCRRIAAHAELSEDQRRVLLGDTDCVSGITFWDGWLNPAAGSALSLDVITVHHPRYYDSGKGASWPTDFDDPTPVPFVLVRPQTRFTLALSAPSQEWRQWLEGAIELLRFGLENEGLGAKTNAGYGRFRCDPPVWPMDPAEVPRALLERIVALKANAPQGFGALRNDLEALPAAAQRNAAVRLKEHLEEFGFWKARNSGKVYYRWVAERLDEK